MLLAVTFLLTNGIVYSLEQVEGIPKELRSSIVRTGLVVEEVPNPDLDQPWTSGDIEKADALPPPRIRQPTTPKPPGDETTKKAFSVAFSNVGCFIKGRNYFEGQFIPGAGTKCQSCYCLRGRSHCGTLKCPEPEPGCRAIFEEDKCCPVSFDCGSPDNRVNSKFSEKVLFNADLSEGDPLSADKKINQNFADPDLLLNQVRKDRQKRIEEEKKEEEASSITEEPSQTTTVLEVENMEGSSSFAGSEANNEEAQAEEKIIVSQDELSSVQTASEGTNEPGKVEVEATGEQRAKEEANPETPQEENIVVTESKAIASDIEAIPEVNASLPAKPEAEESASQNKPNLSHSEDKVETLPTEVRGENDLTPPETSHKDTESSIFSEKAPSPLSALQELLLAAREAQSKREKESPKETPINVENNAVVPEKTSNPETEYEYNTDFNEPIIYDFPSYDINVGSSIFAGTGEEGQGEGSVGVGQVIPVDLHGDGHIRIPPIDRRPPPLRASPPVTPEPRIPTTTEESISFMDAFLNLFGGGRPKTPEEPEVNNGESAWPVSPSFLPGPLRPPPRIPPIQLPGPLRPPPSEIGRRPEVIILDDPPMLLESPVEEIHLEENEAAIENELPPERIIIDPNLPPRRRPPFLRPGLFAPRPNLPLGIRERPSIPAEERDPVPASIFPSLPSDPVIEDGFNAVAQGDGRRPEKVQASLTVIDKAPEVEAKAPQEVSLPPSLPNLEIIPFVAADALVNKKAAAAAAQNKDDTLSAQIPQDVVVVSPPENDGECREGGRVWQDGETVAKGSNPCLTCMCKSGEIVCDTMECPRGPLPPGCRRFRPTENECCPVVKCIEKRPTIPREPEIEEEPTTKFEELVTPQTEEPTTTTRPVQNIPPRPELPPRVPPRRPPFPGRRRPPIGLVDRRPPIIPPRLPPPPPKREEEAPAEAPRRPIIPTRPETEEPTPNPPPRRPDLPFFHRDRPQNGRRPEIIPPRRTGGGFLRRPEGMLSSKPSSPSLAAKPAIPSIPAFLTTTTAPPATTTSTTITTQATLTTTASDEPKEVVVKSDFREEEPFLLPPGLVLPLPIPISNPDIPEDIFENILQDPFNEPPAGKPLDDKHPNVLFSISKPSFPTFPKSTTEPPKIPEHIKNMFPLGTDPILSLGLIELDNCNIHGRIYKVGATIDAMSSECKECRCTPVGVQCLPICPQNY